MALHWLFIMQQSSGGGSGSKVLVMAGAASAVAVGGTVAYASLDKDFRLLVEDIVPGAGSVFDAALGKLEPEKIGAAKKMAEIKVAQ